jgi:hypothetical protein
MNDTESIKERRVGTGDIKERQVGTQGDGVERRVGTGDIKERQVGTGDDMIGNGKCILYWYACVNVLDDTHIIQHFS